MSIALLEFPKFQVTTFVEAPNPFAPPCTTSILCAKCGCTTKTSNYKTDEVLSILQCNESIVVEFNCPHCTTSYPLKHFNKTVE